MYSGRQLVYLMGQFNYMTFASDFSLFDELIVFVFTVRRYASAVYAVVCLSVYLCVNLCIDRRSLPAVAITFGLKSDMVDFA